MEITEKQIKKTSKYTLICTVNTMQIHEHPTMGDESTLLIYDPASSVVFDSGCFEWIDAKQMILESTF